MREYIVDFGDKSSAFVGLAMAEAVNHGANIKCEVVRCRDCKFRREYKTLNEVECLLFDDATFEPKPDGFCAWGERRDA